MLLELLLAGSAIAAPHAAQQNAKAADACPSAEIMMGAHKTAPSQPNSAQPNSVKPGRAVTGDGLLPSPQPESRGPAVLLPDCNPEPPKRRKRKSDYPMV